MPDLVNHPPHYADGWTNGAEVIFITEHLSFCRGNAVKYLARAGRKDPERELEDLHKAQWYLNREVARLERRADQDRIAKGQAARVSAELTAWRHLEVSGVARRPGIAEGVPIG